MRFRIDDFPRSEARFRLKQEGYAGLIFFDPSDYVKNREFDPLKTKSDIACFDDTPLK
jgi:hypothetical protein